MKLLRIMSAITLGMTATMASGQAAPQAPVGLVEQPCAAMRAIPPGIDRYRRSFFDAAPGTKPAPLAAADMEGYKLAQAEALKRDWAGLCRYRDDDILLAGRPAAERRIIFMGDSITENWAAADPALFTDGVVNRGISGQTTPQMLVRFQADVVALHPQAVHIMAGTNDIAGNTGPTSMQDIRNNIMAMVTIARANGIRVLLASTPPAASFPWSRGLKPGPQIRALNDWLRDYAQHVGATYVDYGAVLGTPDGALKSELTFDGVHPNKAGYAAIGAITRRALSAQR
jgi:lysophospholipase L1-like esterase